ncbi:type IV pilus modification PilV family protein [Anaeromyxobacter paludicola]|uniref:Type II secretion system protein n=1 Tax=Anaeromyxobacter paludicola TaxID=2918171 RepID=A0ABN6N9W8_9BACT|nr:prepilin-type N-terminal cleavage/methylation domain-containing protein [Anaeromyxobacter paludicola]BDG09093.1 hypothetical protein AMPC_22060 [Anaeromyxobacter paludicola]
MARRRARGTTLLEAMVAMSVVVVGALGTYRLHVVQLRLNADARRATEASAVARDLVENIALWSYSDPRLANANPSNDADLGDARQAFEQASPPSDHGEADLALGTGWNGIPASALPPGMERYWNVAYPDDADGNGRPDAVRVAVIVRWPHGAGWRRVVAFTTKLDPAEVR